MSSSAARFISTSKQQMTHRSPVEISMAPEDCGPYIGSFSVNVAAKSRSRYRVLILLLTVDPVSDQSEQFDLMGRLP